MKSFMAMLSAAVAASLVAAGGIHAEEIVMRKLHIASPAFAHNGTIPSKYSCDGTDISPPLSIGGVPANAKSLALIVDDPDAPMGTWVHWVVWNILPGAKEIPEGSVPRGAIQGKNDFGERKYGGPCPPSGTHRYFFRMYALDAVPVLEPGSTKARLEEAMKGHVLGQAELVGRYRRK